MTDIRTFLEAAAPVPASEFDVGLLTAPRPRRRRLLGWLAAIAGGFAALGVTSAGLAPATRVDTDRPPAVSEGSAPTESVPGGQDPPAFANPPASASAPVAGEGVAAATPQISRAPEAVPPLVGSDAASADGCEVRVEGSCSYVASSYGGYIASGPNWTISIETDGVTYVFSSAIDDLCADVGFIEPGDKVTLTAGAFAEDPVWPPPATVPDSHPHEGPSSIRAGATAHCGAAPPA